MPSHHLIFLPLLLLFLLPTRPGGAHHVTPACPQTQETCHFTLELSERVTMTTEGDPRPLKVLEVGEDGTVRASNGCGGRREEPDIDLSKVPLGDGSLKRVLLYNNSLPGPPVIVYEGQQVVVTLINNLEEQGTTIHFHGAKQQNTPWMDGVTGVSQCPVNPGEHFTYRFLATPAGTHWYHSHYGSQRSMGAAGTFIVLERDEETVRERRGDFPLPPFEGDFYMLIQDWTRENTEDIFVMIGFDTVKYPYNYNTDICYNSTKQYDGVDSGVLPFVSALINGRGRYNGQDMRYRKRTYVPYEVYKVRQGGYFRFRVIGASMMFPLRVSVDHHQMYLMATDGHHLKPQPADSILVFNGERYDFYIEATDPLSVGNYWIRVQTLEVEQNHKKVEAGYVHAILRYEGAPETDPTTSPRTCTKGNPCHFYNCPYTSVVTVEDHIECHPITDLSLTLPEPTLQPADDEELVEYFLNFHFAFPGPSVTEKPTINGVQHKLAVASPMTYPDGIDQSSEHCHFVSCETGLCRHCEHRLHLPVNKTIQLNFAVTVNNEPGVINGNDHPVHIHGHSLQVLKVGYPFYDPITKDYTTTSTDFSCLQPHCNALVWTNESWAGGHVPGLTSHGAPMKDSLVIPVGGYVVTRFRTDNPGYWFMHCHVEFHNAEGMALVMQIGDESEMNAKPANMPTCGDFHWSEEDFLKHIQQVGENAEEVPDECSEIDNAYKIPAITLGMATLFLAFANTYTTCSKRLRKEEEYQPLAYEGDRAGILGAIIFCQRFGSFRFH